MGYLAEAAGKRAACIYHHRIGLWRHINLLMVRWCQPLFSAALIAFVESHFDNQTEMNALCAVVPSPEQPVDWLRMWAGTLANTQRWRQHETLNAWLSQCRLNGVTAMLRGSKPDDTAKLERLKEVTAKGGPRQRSCPGCSPRGVSATMTDTMEPRLDRPRDGVRQSILSFTPVYCASALEAVGPCP
jgi:hypothetical protein